MSIDTPVALCADRNFALQLATTLAGLDKVTPASQCQTVFALVDGYDAELKSQVISGRSERVAVTWIDVGAQLEGDLPTNFHISRSSYTRLFLASLLPVEVDRVLYLDCDLLFCRPLAELTAIDLAGRALGAVVDMAAPRLALPEGLLGWRDLGLDGRLPYFNGGVLLIDLARWRGLDLEHRLTDHIRSHRDLLRWHDQDVLNGCAAEEFRELPLVWNVQVVRQRTTYAGPLYALYPADAVADAFNNPAIAHFGGYDKPWHATASHSPVVNDWRNLARSTALAHLLDTSSLNAKTKLTVQLGRRRVRRAARVLRRGE